MPFFLLELCLPSWQDIFWFWQYLLLANTRIVSAKMCKTIVVCYYSFVQQAVSLEDNNKKDDNNWRSWILAYFCCFKWAKNYKTFSAWRNLRCQKAAGYKIHLKSLTFLQLLHSVILSQINAWSHYNIFFQKGVYFCPKISLKKN